MGEFYDMEDNQFNETTIDNSQLQMPNIGIQEPIENTVLEQPQSVIETISQDIQIGVAEANNNQLQMSNMENQIQEPVVNNLNGEVPVMQNLQPNMEIEIEKIQEPLDNPILLLVIVAFDFEFTLFSFFKLSNQ